MSSKDSEMPLIDELKLKVNDLLSEEQELVRLEKEVMEANPAVGRLLQQQKEFSNKQAEFWKGVEKAMMDNGIKSIKGPWGTLTIAERTNLSAPDISLVPSKFIKKVLDTTKASAHAKLTGEPPKGVEVSETRYLMKHIKTDVNLEEE